MKGIHRVIIQNKRVRYDFELKRNLTVLRGDSATGKTTLIDMIRENINNRENDSIELTCDKQCFVVEGVTWKGQLSVIEDSIVFIDEGNSFVYTNEFSEAIQQTDNYYVIVSREGLPNLPYSVTEIYGIRTSGKYGGLRQHYNEFYRIYSDPLPEQEIHPDHVITEDSKAGHQFFQKVCEDNGIKCAAAGGKSRILQAAKRTLGNEILLIADGAAFGPEMDRVMKFMAGHKNIYLYVPESFEWLILSANPLKDPSVKTILESPSEHIESGDYYSWERFFTRLLTERTSGTYLQYSKNQLNPAFIMGQVRKQILSEIHKIRFEDL